MGIEIFLIEGKKLIINPACLNVPELKAIMEEYEDNLQAMSYVAYMTDTTVRNPYGNLPKETLKEVLLADFPGSYRPTDQVICDALFKLEKLNDTVINKYYRQVRELVKRLGDWAETVIIDDSKEGNLAHIFKAIEKVGNVSQQFAKAEKEKLDEENRRKGKKFAYDQ